VEKATSKYIAEFIGTFTLVFVGTAVATLQGLVNQGPAGWLGICFAFGFTLMVLVWAIGPVSGCHVNPAVTIAMGLSRRQKWAEVVPYIIAQCAGAIAASAALLTLLKDIPGYNLAQHGLGANGNPRDLSIGTLISWELIMTALFLFTIFSVTRAGSTPGFAGLAIGGFLLVAHLIGVPLGDASLNPARSLGPALFVGGEALRVLHIYILAPIFGAIVGFVLYRLVYEK
jgi:aquaporin Z